MNLDGLFEEIQAATRPMPTIPRPVLLACEGLAISPAELWEALDTDQAAVEAGDVPPAALHAFAAALATSRTRLAGKIPEHYTHVVTCGHCGPVWLWVGSPRYVTSCPWCERSEAEKDFERPDHATVEKL